MNGGRRIAFPARWRQRRISGEIMRGINAARPWLTGGHSPHDGCPRGARPRCCCLLRRRRGRVLRFHGRRVNRQRAGSGNRRSDHHDRARAEVPVGRLGLPVRPVDDAHLRDHRRPNTAGATRTTTRRPRSTSRAASPSKVRPSARSAFATRGRLVRSLAAPTGRTHSTRAARRRATSSR